MPQFPSGLLVPFFLRLAFSIAFRPGNRNTKADTLSRVYSGEGKQKSSPQHILSPFVSIATIQWTHKYARLVLTKLHQRKHPLLKYLFLRSFATAWSHVHLHLSLLVTPLNLAFYSLFPHGIGGIQWKLTCTLLFHPAGKHMPLPVPEPLVSYSCRPSPFQWIYYDTHHRWIDSLMGLNLFFPALPMAFQTATAILNISSECIVSLRTCFLTMVPSLHPSCGKPFLNTLGSQLAFWFPSYFQWPVWTHEPRFRKIPLHILPQEANRLVTIFYMAQNSLI